MELDAFEGRFLGICPDPSHAHDDFDLVAFDFIDAGRGDLPAILTFLEGRDGRGLDDQRVVACDGCWRGDSCEQSLSIMADL